MSDSDCIDPKKLSFSQAQGYEEIPKRLKLEEISDEARVFLWNALYRAIDKTYDWGSDFNPDHVGEPWDEIFHDLHENFFKLRIDEFQLPDLNDLKLTYGINLLGEGKFNKIFDFLQYVMRHEDCPPEFINDVAETFEKCQLAYIVDKEHPVTIYPAATKTEGRTILKARKQLHDNGLLGAETHLRKASDFLDQGRYPESIRESINAVESVARKLDPNVSNSLDKALKALEKGNPVHPALKEALLKLYGYTSDEKGIRHSLIDESQANVGIDEAVFMLGACASFSSYLLRKYKAD